MRLPTLSSTLPFLLSLASPLVSAIAITPSHTAPRSNFQNVKFEQSILTLDPHFVITSFPETRVFNFVVSTVIGAPDGFDREMLVINGQYPAPLIEANAGDTIIVNVQNNLLTGTGIHWHGMKQKGSNWADGVPGFSQCPIPAGTSFTYKFTIADDQYGTYWYHSHMGNTMADGLVGPLIIHSPNEPIVRGRDFDYEQIIFLGDWMHDLSDTIINAFINPPGLYRGAPFAPAPDALLINNRGSYYACSTTPGCVDPGMTNVDVVAGKKWRIRLINHSSHVHYKFSIDNHPLTVVAADGIPIVPLTNIHQVPIGLAQRYDLILNTNVGKPGSSYFIRAGMCVANIPGIPTGFSTVNTAALRYTTTFGTGASTSTPTTADWSDNTYADATCYDFADSQLVPYAKSAVPIKALDSTILSSRAGAITVGNTSLVRFFFDDITWKNYIYEPLFFTVHDGKSVNSSAIANHVFNGLGGGDIVLNNLDTFLDHPYHLHGNPFYIVARGVGTLDAAGYAALTFNTHNPPNRDVITVPRGNYAVLRIMTDNAGVWPLHCHIGWHLAIGKMAAIIVQPELIQQQYVPNEALQLCNSCELPAGETSDTIAPGKRSSSAPSPEFKRAQISHGQSSSSHHARANRLNNSIDFERSNVERKERSSMDWVKPRSLGEEMRSIIDKLKGGSHHHGHGSGTCKNQYY